MSQTDKILSSLPLEMIWITGLSSSVIFNDTLPCDAIGQLRLMSRYILGMMNVYWPIHSPQIFKEPKIKSMALCCNHPWLYHVIGHQVNTHGHHSSPYDGWCGFHVMQKLKLSYLETLRWICFQVFCTLYKYLSYNSSSKFFCSFLFCMQSSSGIFSCNPLPD